MIRDFISLCAVVSFVTVSRSGHLLQPANRQLSRDMLRGYADFVVSWQEVSAIQHIAQR